jgi:nucleotide-binding universal stress UspA family protein
MFERIFVPLDGSSDSESVLGWLRSWGLSNSKSILFHCIPAKPPNGEVEVHSRFPSSDHAQEYLDGVARTVGSPTEILVRSGTPGERIVTAALQSDAGVVVLGLTGDYGSPRTLNKTIGIVARTFPQPVLILKTPARPTRRRVRRILAPLNAAARGDENMDVLRDVARDLHAEVILLHVGSQDSETLLPRGGAASYSDVQLNLIRQVWGFLKDGIAARTIMTKGSIVEETLVHEQSLDIDLVAIPRETAAASSFWEPIVGKCERAVLLYEPKEVTSAIVPATTRVAALRT